jgi:sugar phosphate isomerase/epimerase
MDPSRLAVCSWSLRPADPQDLVEKLRRLEIDAVQLDLGLLCEDSKTWYPAMQLLPEAGIRIVSGMIRMKDEDYSTLDSIRRTGGVRPDETWSANRTRAEMVVPLAEEIGIDLITFHAGFIPEAEDDPERTKLIDRLRELADLFARNRLRLGLETGQETAETLLEALGELDRHNVGVNFDPANMILYGMGDPVDALCRLSPRIMQVHVKDAVPSDRPGEWGREVPVGEGAVDWAAFFNMAASIDPPVDFVIETEGGDDPVGVITRARDVVHQHLR